MTLKFHLILILLILSISCGRDTVSKQPQKILTSNIYGGEKPPKGTWPSAVEVRYKCEGMKLGENCSGSLVDRDIVLTAAHCIPKNVDISKCNYYFAKTSMFEYGIKANAVEILVHPNYYRSPTTLKNDVAFIKLDSTKISESIAPYFEIIPLATKEQLEEYLVPNNDVIMVGYGKRKNGTSGGYYLQLKAKIKSIGKEQFAVESYGETANIGDSGGPAYIQLSDGSYRVAGVISNKPSIKDNWDNKMLTTKLDRLDNALELIDNNKKIQDYFNYTINFKSISTFNLSGPIDQNIYVDGYNLKQNNFFFTDPSFEILVSCNGLIPLEVVFTDYFNELKDHSLEELQAKDSIIHQVLITFPSYDSNNSCHRDIYTSLFRHRKSIEGELRFQAQTGRYLLYDTSGFFDKDQLNLSW